MRTPELALLALGALLIVIAIGWLTRVVDGRIVALRDALADPDPAIRRSALEGVGKQGLSRYANMLLHSIETESDPGCLDALAAAIARNQWEPADSGLNELRLWAARRFDQTVVPATSPAAAAGPHPDDANPPPLVETIESVLGERVLHLRLSTDGQELDFEHDAPEERR